ncbi:MAG TPA: AI-2E family transporter [Acidobacteriota bacterium]|nr:AI-2E family transporter [Acidobacteriota bacterium]HNT18074.1 AI-2E family transporter [Acidobacteriota bacterium]HPA27461.1 AI-2E family transporter [Acidobacteriota bacterium]HQO20879.1 AI-2E family transporter [Acidobacteriota bacterium]HQQ47756.1 AI-2E family transporter [Acidobacteriota bacterium]
MDKKLLYSLLAFAAIICTISLMVFLLSPFLGSIVWAFVLALAANPIHRRILKLFKGRQNIAAFCSAALVFLFLAVPFFLLSLIFAGQAFDVLSSLEDDIQKGQIPIVKQVAENPAINNYIEKARPYLKDADINSISMATMKGVWNFLALISKKLTLNIFSAIFQFFMTILLLFFAFRDGETILKTLWEIVPLKDSDKAKIEDIVKRVVGAVLYGIVLACVAQGTLGGIGFAIAGLPAPVFYGAIMTICAFVPVVGPALVWAPAVIYLFVIGDTGNAVFLLIWCLTVVSCIDNVIRPIYISGKSKIPLPIIVLGVLGGLMTLGFLGIILGPLLFSLFVEAIRIYKEEILHPSPQAETENIKA